MKTYRLALCLAALLSIFMLAGCDSGSGESGSASSSGPAVVENNAMQYMSKEDLKAAVESGAQNLVVLDLRKAADYAKSHVVGSFSADVDKAKSGDNADGINNLKAALKEATGSETANADSKIVLLCYSGKSYAQKGTDLLINMGVPAANIVTLQGGYKDWTSDDYEKLLVSGDKPGSVEKQ